MIQISSAVLKSIQSAVQLNDHGDAYLQAAQALNAHELVTRFSKVNRRQLELGHLPPELYQERQQAYQELLKVARDQLEPASYKAFYCVL